MEVYSPLPVVINLSSAVFANTGPVQGVIRSISRYAGAAIGTAVVGYPGHYAKDAQPDMGDTATLYVGGRVAFRGVVGDAPMDIAENVDEVELRLFDDKWQMQANTIGQLGIGTEGSPAGSWGWPCVGFEVVFNKDGKPNKHYTDLTFLTGAAGDWWTLKDILEFVFTHYIASSAATLDTNELSSAYDRIPSHLSLVGMDGLAAVDAVVQLAGESWGLTPGGSASRFVPVVPGSGTQRTVRLFAPKAGRKATEANFYFARECTGGTSIRRVRDAFQALSAPIVKEHTYSNKGADPLLTPVNLKDKEYHARWRVDRTKYEEHSLGYDLAAGCDPKPWLPHLVTRLAQAGDAYLTKADIDTDPGKANSPRLPKPLVWVSLDGTEAKARLCTGGIRIDTEHCTLDLKPQLDLMPDTGDTPEQIDITGINIVTTLGIWFTVCTVLEIPDSEESATGSQFLPRTFYQVIHKPDLVPERRQDVWLPDLAGNNNAVSKVAVGASEKYIDISDKLEDAVEAAMAASPRIETPVVATFPFVPPFNIGDRLDIGGRNIRTTGNEVVIEISYQFHEAVPSAVRVKASSVAVGIDPERFEEPA